MAQVPAKVQFYQLIQDEQDLGTADDYMHSRVRFRISVNGGPFKDGFVHIKQIVGGSFEADPLEVIFPEGRRGPLNYEPFREAAEQYYRSSIGSSGSGIRISGAGNVRMRNNTINALMTVEFHINSRDAAW